MIEFKEGRYFGIYKGSSKKIQILGSDIESIKLRDRKAFTRKTIIVSILGIGVLFSVVYQGLGGQDI